MFHSLDSPLSVNSSPVAFPDFSRSNDDDKYGCYADQQSMLALDLDFPHFDMDDELGSILLPLHIKDENMQQVQQQPQQPQQQQYPTYNTYVNAPALTNVTDPSMVVLKKKVATTKTTSRKPLVLQPFLSVWDVEVCVRKLKEFESCSDRNLVCLKSM